MRGGGGKCEHAQNGAVATWQGVSNNRSYKRGSAKLSKRCDAVRRWRRNWGRRQRHVWEMGGDKLQDVEREMRRERKQERKWERRREGNADSSWRSQRSGHRKVHVLAGHALSREPTVPFVFSTPSDARCLRWEVWCPIGCTGKCPLVWWNFRNWDVRWQKTLEIYCALLVSRKHNEIDKQSEEVLCNKFLTNTQIIKKS